MNNRKHFALVCTMIFCCFFGVILYGKSYDSDFERVRPSTEIVRVEVHGDKRGFLPFYYQGDLYYSRGTKTVEAAYGERFSLVVRNDCDERVGLVISIDGRNIISGKRSYLRPDESMYVLNAGQTGDFSGWRSDISKVQRFYFTDSADSYAGRMGDSSQVGWIKVAVFRERRIVRKPYYLDSGSSDFEERNRAVSEKHSESPQAGTGYGEGSYSPVELTEFEPESFAAQFETVHYEFPQPYRIYEKHDFASPPPR